MRITYPLPGPTIGLTTIMREAPVLELDAGYPLPSPSPPPSAPATFAPSPSALHAIHALMVLIIPCKDEDPTTLLGVFQGIPQPCTILLVSASRTQAAYDAEAALLRSFCRPSARRGLAVHQRDPLVAAALAAAGMAPLLSGAAVRAGKGEGMILGLAVALALFPEQRYVGFLDADAKMPGAPSEYCRVYATGFAAYHNGGGDEEEEEDVMVRIHWGSKPKPRRDGSGGLDFGVAEGRSSRIVNEWMNKFVEAATGGGGGGEDKVITTGNAGEHAMTMSLARKLRMAGGYAIEPFHYVDLFIRQMRAAAAASGCASPASSFGTVPGYDDDVLDALDLSSPMTRSSSFGSTGSGSGSGSGSGTTSSATSVRSMVTSHSSAYCGSDAGHSGTSDLVVRRRGDDMPPVRVVQIKTINAHIHRETDDAHVRAMWKMGLGTLYHHLLPEFIQSAYVGREVAEAMVRLRAEMEAFVEEKNREVGDETAEGEPLLPEPRVYPALETVDMEVLGKMLDVGGGSLVRIGF